MDRQSIEDQSVRDRLQAEIEARARAEQALQESDERFRFMVESVQDHAIFMMDPGGTVISWNAGAERILGYSAEEVLGQTGDRFFIPDDRARGLPQEERRGAAATGRFIDENWLQRKDGSRFWASGVSTALRSETGELKGFAKIFRDLSERKAAEESLKEITLRLQTALAAGRMGTWLWDVESNRQILDDSLSQLAGLPPGTSVRTFEEFLDLIHPEDRQKVADAFQLAIDKSAPFQVDFRVPLADGSVRWLHDQGDVVLGTQGQLKFIAGACVDISDRRAAEESVRQLNVELDERVRRRTRELQDSEDQLRAVAATARQRADRLQQLANMITRVEQQERRRLARLLHDHVQQLLVAAKMRVDVARTDLPPDSLTDELDGAVAILNEAIAATRALSVQLAPPLLHDRGLPDALRWLATRMREQHRLNMELKLDDTANPPSEEQRDVLFQAAQELLLNVVKHSGVSRAAMTLERSQDQVWIEVADKGKGADSTNLASQNSFGLFHLRQRLEAIGGTLIVEALEGSGTRVCVTLPMSTDASSNPQSSEHGTTPADVQVAGTGLIRVVLADDHPLVREGLLSLLRREPDIEIVGEAGDGRAAVDMVARLRPDVVLMDVSMPVLDGVEATRRVVSMSPDVRIIGLSLDAHPETARAMLDAGAVEFITKNSPRQQLVSTIRLVTGRLDNN